VRGALAILIAFLWTSAPLRADDKDQTNVRSREIFCFETTGKDKGQPIPCPTVEVGMLGGGVVSMGSDAGAKMSPLVRVLVSLPLAQGQGQGWVPLPPVFHVQVDLSALPGATSFSFEDVGTWRTLEFRLGISQRLHDALNADLYAEAGFATRLPGELEARDRAVRWAAAGVRLGRFGDGWLSLGVGADQRLDGTYRPAVLLAGALRLQEKAGVSLYLVGDAVLGIDTTLSATPRGPRRDVVRIGLALGR
jgi:hypothetical protein